MSEPKRTILASSVNTTGTSKEASSHSGVDLFTERSDRVFHAAREDPPSRKRKEMEAELQMEELMSIMSEDMDCFEEKPSHNKGQQAQLIVQSSAEEKQGLNTTEVSSLSKRQRVHKESGNNRSAGLSLENDSTSSKDQKLSSEQHIISIKKEQVHPSEYGTAMYQHSKPSEKSSASMLQPFEDDDASFVEVSQIVFQVVFSYPNQNRPSTHLFLAVLYVVMFHFHHLYFRLVGCRTTQCRCLPGERRD